MAVYQCRGPRVDHGCGQSLISRLNEYVAEDGTSDCWTWTGPLRNGYGRIRTCEGLETAHRVSYALFTGPIPPGLDLDHLCRNRACINPDHLEPVTRRESIRRSPIHGAATAHCVKGHEYTEATTHTTGQGETTVPRLRPSLHDSICAELSWGKLTGAIHRL